jgi:hypothetical protein
MYSTKKNNGFFTPRVNPGVNSDIQVFICTVLFTLNLIIQPKILPYEL